MNKPLLTDKNEYPADDVLLRYLDKTKAVWDLFTAHISTDFPLMVLEWRFYNDGKSWLCKLVHKKKTVCWISIWDKHFKTTFYFTEKDNGEIDRLNIDQVLKEDYLSHKPFGKLKPLTIDVTTRKVLRDVFEVITYKSKPHRHPTPPARL